MPPFHTENARDFSYFYQSATGENLFLHPLCFKMLDQQYQVDKSLNTEQVKFPLTLEASVLEIEHAIADQEEVDFMSKRWGVGGDYHRCVDHLPDGAPYGFVEIDMSDLIYPEVYSKFEKIISNRDRQRKRRNEREENYTGKVEKLQDEKFEKIKREAIHAVNTESVHLRPKAINHAIRSSA